MKKLFLITAILLTFVFVLVPFSTYAATHHSTYKDVYDSANLLSDTEEKNLAELAEDLSDEHNIHVIFLTFDDAEGKSTMRYTDDFMDNLYFNESSILFAIDMDNRECYVNTVGSCINALSDSEREQVLDMTFDYLSNGQYYEFLKKTCEKSMDKMYGTGALAEDLSEKWYIPDMNSVIVSLLIMAVTTVILLVQHNKANKKISATNYISKDGYQVYDKKEVYVRTYETVQHDYYKQSSSSSGGGSSSHSSSSGVSHGGGGRKF